jgi:hypothetical protein
MDAGGALGALDRGCASAVLAAINAKTDTALTTPSTAARRFNMAPSVGDFTINRWVRN